MGKEVAEMETVLPDRFFYNIFVEVHPPLGETWPREKSPGFK